MVRPLATIDRDAPPRGGVRLRAVDVEADPVAVHELDAASFAAVPDYPHPTFGEFHEEHLAAHDLDPALSCVAELGETIVGFLLARRWATDAADYVAVLAVHPDHQHRGLGTALLRHACIGSPSRDSARPSSASRPTIRAR